MYSQEQQAPKPARGHLRRLFCGGRTTSAAAIFFAALLSAGAVLMPPMPAVAADDDAAPTAEEQEKKPKGVIARRIARTTERLYTKYTPTGESKICINITRLRQSHTLADDLIFFETRGSKAYQNRLPNQCPRLTFEDRFIYSTTVSQLCRGEIITVLDVFGRPLGACSLGDFEEFTKADKKEKAK